MSHPKFVVVGHPNKGKSSIVSTLTLNDSVQISDTPGTTKLSRSFCLKDEKKTYYELIDTPGFQRARKTLKYLKSFGEVSPTEKPKLLKKFITEFEHDKKYTDEIELLRPITQGAGIIYVVDASNAYSNEYEAGMEILRYSGAPSMAILNFIGDDDYTKEWDSVLGQYFRLVKKFNPLDAVFEDHINLLEGMSHLYEPWSKDLKEAIVLLTHREDIIKNSVANLIATLIQEALSLKITRGRSYTKKMMYDEYTQELKALERRFQTDLIEKLSFSNLEYKIEEEIFEFDLFSKKSQEIFGLSKQRLVFISMMSGALMGSGVDAIFGGATLLLGSLAGGIIGAGSALYGYEELAKISFISSTKIEIGPVKDVNFGFILLNRALIFTLKLMHKTHADRTKEVFTYNREFLEDLIDSDLLSDIEKLHVRFKKGEHDKASFTRYVKLIEGIIG